MLLKISFLLPDLLCNAEFEFSWFHKAKHKNNIAEALANFSK